MLAWQQSEEGLPRVQISLFGDCFVLLHPAWPQVAWMRSAKPALSAQSPLRWSSTPGGSHSFPDPHVRLGEVFLKRAPLHLAVGGTALAWDELTLKRKASAPPPTHMGPGA